MPIEPEGHSALRCRVHTLGIDLSAEPTKTAFALIRWSEHSATIERLEVGADNQTLMPLIERAEKVGIDCPLGWPIEFLTFVTGHCTRALNPHAGERIPGRDRLAFRETDRHLRERGLGQPLSVSTDRVGRAAMRVAGLLAAIESDTAERVDRSGSGKIVEVYPAAALKQWSIQAAGYKTDHSRLCSLVDGFIERTASWLSMSDDYRNLCKRSDDAFDAVIAGLNARAATLPGGVITPVDDQHEAAAIEGWIAVPTGTLDDLRPRSSH